MPDLEHREEGGRIIISKRKTAIEEQRTRIQQLEIENVELKQVSADTTVSILDLYEQLNPPV